MKNNQNLCSIVITSCDAYRDAWEPFFTLFFRYWPDCPFNIYLVSNTEKYPDERVQTLTITPDLKWSSNLTTSLKLIPTKYIIYFQEDYFLRSRVDNNKIFQALSLAEETKAAYIRLFPCPGPDTPYQDRTDIGLISQNAVYRNSTQTAIWNKEQLINLLKPGETGWDFEMRGGLERARLIKEPFFAYHKPIINYFCTAILKGMYLFDAIKFARGEGIKLDHKARKFENYFHYIFRITGTEAKMKKFFRPIINFIKAHRKK
jgi:hypothetical protein